jgi:hypothetical protein
MYYQQLFRSRVESISPYLTMISRQGGQNHGLNAALAGTYQSLKSNATLTSLV